MSSLFLPFKVRNRLSGWAYRFLLRPWFKNFGNGSLIVSPNGIEGIQNIDIGNCVYIAAGALLAAVPLSRNGNCTLSIGDQTKIGRNNHFYATKSIRIGHGVLTAGNVYISDNTHGYESTLLSIVEQPVKQLAPVLIGNGSWLGQGVCVIGASVGSNCVVGANSVVTRDIPDHCVAVGAPARVIKRYDSTRNCWLYTDDVGGRSARTSGPEKRSAMGDTRDPE